jgi:hypothetical protein
VVVRSGRYICLFVCGLLNDAAHDSDYIESSGGVTDE